jgi:hypothetical protein
MLTLHNSFVQAHQASLANAKLTNGCYYYSQPSVFGFFFSPFAGATIVHSVMVLNPCRTSVPVKDGISLVGQFNQSLINLICLNNALCSMAGIQS